MSRRDGSYELIDEIDKRFADALNSRIVPRGVVAMYVLSLANNLELYCCPKCLKSARPINVTNDEVAYDTSWVFVVYIKFSRINI